MQGCKVRIISSDHSYIFHLIFLDILLRCISISSREYTDIWKTVVNYEFIINIASPRPFVSSINELCTHF